MEKVGDPEYMLSLARGLAVLEKLAGAERPMTISELSRTLDFSRAAVRRCLYTLGVLGYARNDERGFRITARPMALSHALLSPIALAGRAQPLLDQLRDQLGESCSLGVLEDDYVRYVCRAEAYRIMTIGLRVGSRLPLYLTSMGRVLLSAASDAQIEAYLARTPLTATTALTQTDAAAIKAIVRGIATDGFAIVDQELELGLRSIAVPVTSRGAVVAALNVGTSAARVSLDEMRTRYLPAIAAIAGQLSS